MKTSIGIKSDNRQAVSNSLSKLLADEYILYTKTRNAHWNVEGADFYDKHKFFEGQYEQINSFIDDIAERIRSLGHYTPATLKVFLELTRLSEEKKPGNSSADFMKELLHDHESIIICLREDIEKFSTDYKDAGSSDFITGLLEAHEKMAWFLRAHF